MVLTNTLSDIPPGKPPPEIFVIGHSNFLAVGYDRTVNTSEILYIKKSTFLKVKFYNGTVSFYIYVTMNT